MCEVKKLNDHNLLQLFQSVTAEVKERLIEMIRIKEVLTKTIKNYAD